MSYTMTLTVPLTFDLTWNLGFSCKVAILMKNSRFKRFATRSIPSHIFSLAIAICLNFIHAVLLTTQTWHHERWPRLPGYLFHASYCVFCKNIRFFLKHLPILETTIRIGRIWFKLQECCFRRSYSAQFGLGDIDMIRRMVYVVLEILSCSTRGIMC